METRVAVSSIIIEDVDKVSLVNNLLHDYRDYIIGRMGIPYKEKSIYIISIAINAPNDSITALTGKIGKINGITAKATFSNY